MLLLLFLVPAAMAERLVIIGDSLTAGYGLDPELAYPALTEQILREKGREITVVNAGLSGDTTAGGLRRLPWILRQDIDILIIALGSNDALRGQPPASTKENLRAMIRLVRKEQPGTQVVLAEMRSPPNLGADYQAAFDRIFGELAKEEETGLLPFILNGVAGIPDLNQADGIHPNTRGHAIMAGNLVRFLEDGAAVD